MNWEQVADELNKPLERGAVKQRQQGTFKLSYIEGWHAIAEANRIFGHRNWDRETVEMLRCGEPYQNDKQNWVVNYVCRVRVSVGSGARDTARDGSGFGSGIDRDLGRAHESAVKEAETDATKRALMTFGWPFGLALYDKTQEHVSDGATPDQSDLGSIKGDGPVRFASNVPYEHLEKELKRNDNPPDVNLWWSQNKPTREKQLNSEHRWFLFLSMVKHGLDHAADLEELKGFWISHATELKELTRRNKSEYDGLCDYKDKAKGRFQANGAK